LILNPSKGYESRLVLCFYIEDLEDRRLVKALSIGVTGKGMFNTLYQKILEMAWKMLFFVIMKIVC